MSVTTALKILRWTDDVGLASWLMMAAILIGIAAALWVK